MSIDHAPPVPRPLSFSDADFVAAYSVFSENLAKAFVAGEMYTTDLNNLARHVRQELEDKLKALSFHTDPAERWSAWCELVHEVARVQQFANDELDMDTVPAHFHGHQRSIEAYLDGFVGDAVKKLVGTRIEAEA